MRWTASRKADVLARIDRDPEQAPSIMAEHRISAEELIDWRRGHDRAGHAGLKLKALAVRPGVQRRGEA